MSPSPANEAVTSANFAARLDGLAPPRRFAIAVSGGRDSMALARLAADYAKTRGAWVIALTVDHGLRKSAAAEAETVKRWCAEIGLPHETLVWRGEKPVSGIQAAARAARYRLLAQAAHGAACEALLTAHTMDDQAETAFMRLRRGAGARGLGAMREEVLVAAGAGAPLRLLRPLLGFSRAAMTATLEARAQGFVDDPSNDDPAYERVRVRALLAALGEQDLLSVPALAETARKLRAGDLRLRAQEDALFDRLGGCFHGWGGISLGRWPSPQESGWAGLARRLIFAVGGGAHYSDEAACADAAGRASAASAEGRAATVGGALIKLWNNRLWFLREPSALTGRAGVAPMALAALDQDLLWDNRFIIHALPPTAAQGLAGLAVGPIGAGKTDEFSILRSGSFDGPPEAVAALPGVYHDDVLIGAPAPLSNGLLGNNAKAGRDKADAAASIVCVALARERFAGQIIRFS